MNNMQFPIMVLPTNSNEIIVFTKQYEQILHYCNWKQFQNDYFKGAWHIDAKGNIHIVKNVLFRKYRGIKGFIFPFFKDKHIIVDYEYEPETTRIPLDKMKEILFERSIRDMDKELWEEGYTKEDIKEYIYNTNSFKELILSFYSV